jgi:uncharacterized protein YqeY
MLRQAFRDRLKEAMKARDSRTVSTVRLILASLKDRDVAEHGQGNPAGLSESEIQRMLQAMIKQRRESIALYRQGNRPNLAQQESEEIVVIESFLPRQLDEGEIEAAAKAVIDETGAATVKDLGKVMAALRERHTGVIDLGRAGAIVRRLLG